MGKKVICYFSAGSYEDWRPDASEFKKEDLGRDLDGWPGEKWLDLDSENVRRVMKGRVELAKEKGCDGVDPDNVDGYVSKHPPPCQSPPCSRMYTNNPTSKTTTASPSPPPPQSPSSPTSPP